MAAPMLGARSSDQEPAASFSKPKICLGRSMPRAQQFSVLVRRVDLVELLEQRGPLEQAETAADPGLVEMRGRLDQILGRHGKLGIARKRHHLQLAGALQAKGIVECLGDARTDDE